MKRKPDHKEVSWTIGSETFTRKEVEALLLTQIAIISNDLKRKAMLAPEIIEVLDNPRKPEF